MGKEFSSDTRVILATSFPAFREIVLEYTLEKEDPNQWIFNQGQLDQIRLSPHHNYLWRDIAKIGVDILIIKRQSLELRIRFLQRENIIKNTIEQIRNTKQEDPKKAADIEKKFRVQYDRTEDSLQTLNVLLDSETHKLAGELDNLMIKHDQEWNNQRFEFTEKLIKALEKNNLISDYEKTQLNLLLSGKKETITQILQEYEVSHYPLPLEVDKIRADSGNYFLLLANLSSAKTSSQTMQTIEPQEIYRKVKDLLKDFFNEEKTAAGKLRGDEEKSRAPLIKEKNNAYDTLRQLWEQDVSQYQAVRDLLEMLTSTIGVNIKLKEEEQKALERALDEEFDYELEIKEGLRYG